MHLAIYQIVCLIIVFVLTGSLGGFLSGFFGLGGGVLYIPVFYTVFESLMPGSPNDMHAAIGTSLALIIPSSIASARRHYKLGNVDLHFSMKWMAAIFIGAILGVLVLNYAPSVLLETCFTVFLYIIVVFTFFNKSDGSKPTKQPGGLVLYPSSFSIGFVSVILGISGGLLTVPFFKAFHYPYKKAVAVSACGGLVVSLVGTILIIATTWKVHDLPKFSIGYVNWFAFVCILPFTTFFAPIGAKLVTKTRDSLVNRLYFVILLALAIYMTIKIS